MQFSAYVYTVASLPTRYYVNGKQASREAYDNAKQGKYLQCFQTIKTRNGYRHLCCG